MAGQNIPLNSFSGGEIGLEALARIDLDIYPTCAEVMENAMPTMRGSLVKAQGTEYIGTVDADTAIVRSFEFNTDQTRVMEISDSEIRLVDGREYVTLVGAAGTIGAPADNGSSGSGSSTVIAGQNVTFICGAGGSSNAAWEVTAGVNGVATTFAFQITRRPVKISVGTTLGSEDILSETTFEPGDHIVTILPTATTYYIRAEMDEHGKAQLLGLTRKDAGKLVIPTPYLAADLKSLRFEQSNDVVWIYHKNYRTRVLERRGDTSWSLRLFRPKNGPFEIQNTSETTLTPSGTVGSVTVESSRPRFAANAVGQLLELEHQGQTEVETFTAVDQASEPIRVIGIEANRKFQLSIVGSFVGTIKLQRSFGNTVDWVDHIIYTAPASITTIDDGLDNQIVYYRFLVSAYTSGTPTAYLVYAGGSTVGRGEIVEYTSPTEVVVEVYENFGAIVATARWSEGSWSDDLGWPACGQISGDGKHCIMRDDRFFSSESDDYEGFEIGSDPGDAISRVVGAGGVNFARWIELGSRIVVGTSGGEIEIGSNELQDALTLTNIRGRPIGDDGAADAQAVRAGKRIVYIDSTRSRLLQAYLDSESGETETDNLVRLHEKIAGEIEQDSDDGFQELAWQRSPEPRIWTVRSDGQLAVQLYAPREGIYGWGRVTGASGGKFKSVCVIRGKPEDRVHVLVEREIDGETALYHERFSLCRFPIVTNSEGKKHAPKAWRLQCALVTDGAPASTFGGLEHLEGMTVGVWADGRDGGQHTVTGGEITLDFEASYVIIGLLYRGKWKSVKMAFGARNGTALGQDKTIGPLGIVTHETPIGALKYGRSFEAIDGAGGDQLMNEFEEGMLMDEPVELVSREDNQPFEGETYIDSRVCLVMDGPAPVTVLALVPNVEITEHA